MPTMAETKNDNVNYFIVDILYSGKNASAVNRDAQEIAVGIFFLLNAYYFL